MEDFDRRCENGEDTEADWVGKPMSPAQFARHLKRKGIQVPHGV